MKLRILSALSALLIACSAQAQIYMGDVLLGQTVEHVYPLYTTAGAMVERTVAGTPSCYENGGVNEITAGVTDTGTAEFDSKVGMNLFTVVATAANGFESGKRYSCGNKDATLNGNANMWIPVLDFTVEDRYPLKGLILARGTITTGSTTTVANVGAFLTFENQWATRVILNANTGERQIITSSHDSGSSDTITFAAAVPTAWANNDPFLILGESPQYVLRLPNLDSAGNAIVGALVDATHPINARTADNWITFNYNANAANLFTLADLSSGLNAISNNTSSVLTALSLLNSTQILFTGTAESGTNATLVDNALTQADTDYWAKATAIVFLSGSIAGQVVCTTAFTPAADRITFAPVTTQPVGTNNYALIAAPGCKR